MNLRSVMNAILYLASAGCAGRLLPKDFPSLSTVQGYFYVWRDSGTGALAADASQWRADSHDQRALDRARFRYLQQSR